MIGFYLRAIRISSPEFLDGDIAFKKVHSPIVCTLSDYYTDCVERQENIYSKRKEERKINFLVVPYTGKGEIVTKLLSNAGLTIAHDAGKRIMGMVRRNGGKGERA